jgi:hypothetical protein
VISLSVRARNSRHAPFCFHRRHSAFGGCKDCLILKPPFRGEKELPRDANTCKIREGGQASLGLTDALWRA